jgi:hypothetical protein
MFSEISEMSSLIVYSGMKINWSREENSECYGRGERAGIAA